MSNEPVAIVKKITISGIDNFSIERFTELKEGTLRLGLSLVPDF